MTYRVYALLLTAPQCPECGQECVARAHAPVGNAGVQGHGYQWCKCPARHEWRRERRVRADTLGLSAVEADWLAQIAASCGPVLT